MSVTFKNVYWEGFELTVNDRGCPRGKVEMAIIDELLFHGHMSFDDLVGAVPNNNAHYEKLGWGRGRIARPKRAYVAHVLRDMKRVGTLRYERPYWSLVRADG